MFPVGTTVQVEYVDSDIRKTFVGQITRIDENDDDFPYLVEGPDGDPQWWSADQIAPVAATDPTKLLGEIVSKVATIDAKFEELKSLSANLRSVLETNKTYVPIGICTQCMEDVEFNRNTGEWPMHGEAPHTPPAIIPKPSRPTDPNEG